jgi:hypothetical protein
MVSIPKFIQKPDLTSNVAICVPVRDLVTSTFSYSLAMLMKKCGERGQKVSLHMVMGSEVAMQRQQLVDEVLETSATHIFWVDSDMKFPPDTLFSLLSHKKDIVGANYSTRVKPHRPVAFKNESNLDKRVFGGTGVEEVFALGSGLLLVNKCVYENILRPHYSVEWNDDYTNLMGEDIYFCKKASMHGYTSHVDNALSDRVAHIGMKEYTIKGDCYD